MTVSAPEDDDGWIAPKGLAPVWLLGMGFLPLGIWGIVTLVNLPQLLAAAHVPEVRIASITAIGLAPGFLSFLPSPILDWRFSRRTYALVFSGLSGLCLTACLLRLNDLTLLPGLLFVGGLSINLYVAAIGGWFGNLVATERKAALGAWFTVANLGGGGAAGFIALQLFRGLPPGVGAAVVGLGPVICTPLLLLTPCPPADGRLASESFRDFARDVAALLRRRQVLWILVFFLSPAAAFALTNILGGLGRDFAASEAQVAMLGGAGILVAGVAGSLAVPPLARRMDPVWLYLLVGTLGAGFTLSLLAMARSPTTFGMAMIGENLFQAASFSVQNVIILRTIGHRNPLAATQFGLLNAAGGFPLAYMQYLDGQGYGLAGVTGSFVADAAVSAAAALILAALIWLMKRRGRPIL